MRNTKQLCAVVCISLATLLASCSSVPPQRESVAEFVQFQKTAARHLQSEGRPADSLTLWRTVIALHNTDLEALAAIEELEQLVAEKVNRAWVAGIASYKRGNSGSGDIWMLKVLAAQPGHEGALAKLSRSQSGRVQAEQRDKNSVENRKLLARQHAAPGGINQQLSILFGRQQYQEVLNIGAQVSVAANKEAAGFLRKSHIALADQAEKDAELERALAHVQAALTAYPQAADPLLSRAATLAKQLSSKWYKEGLLLLNEDLPAAIDALEESLSYNPYNDAAKRKLLQAKKLQKNLQRIKGSG